MSVPKTTNGLMKHLRDKCNVQISGNYQKKQLISYGYYHGYKGYRFVKNSTNKIPFTDFSEVVAVIEYDNNLKSALYPILMFIETAIKNIVCNESLSKLKCNTFDYVYNERMNDNISNTKLQSKRLKLRNEVYSKISHRYHDEEKKDSKMVRHFYNKGEDIPLWVVFEILYLSDLANFFECLNHTSRENILNKLNMLNKATDTNLNLLSTMLYTLKSLRNAVAHNSIIFDTRFKDRDINKVLKSWTENETSIRNITLYSLIDYIIIICCILKRIDFSESRAIELLEKFRGENEKLKQQVSPTIYAQIIQNNVNSKIEKLEEYLKS